jgi:hypothetical protein
MHGNPWPCPQVSHPVHACLPSLWPAPALAVECGLWHVRAYAFLVIQREDLVRNGVAFLRHPSVAGVSWADRVAFLRSKGLTDEEITTSQAQASAQGASSPETGGVLGGGAFKPSASGGAGSPSQGPSPGPSPSPGPGPFTSALQWLTAAAVGAGAYHVFGDAVAGWLGAMGRPGAGSGGSPPPPDPALATAAAGLEEAQAANRSATCARPCVAVCVCVCVCVSVCVSVCVAVCGCVCGCACGCVCGCKCK